MKEHRETSLRCAGRAIRRVWWAIFPGPRAWSGAALGIVAAVVLITLLFSYDAFAVAGFGYYLVGALALLAGLLLISVLAALLERLWLLLPARYRWVLPGALVGLLVSFLSSLFIGAALTVIAVLLFASLLGAGLAVLLRGGWRELTPLRRGIMLVGLVVGALGAVGLSYFLLVDGFAVNVPLNAAAESAAQVTSLALPDPSQPGAYRVRELTYGNGDDTRRPEYGELVTLRTGTVDGSPFLEGWSRLRRAYWGFGPEALPLNGRVWYPEGPGPFPLVLIVHGNHPMEEFSDPGYAYLGELLASRGFIVASVDENFLNMSLQADWIFFAGLEEENDARGWLLLEHLALWRDWNADPAQFFYGKVDLDNIALIGHSRGGDAVQLAAAFNRLSHYPDDATVAFDYDFGIRAVVGIAPVDGQYWPGNCYTPLENVNYLVLHGAHDMDVFSFDGARIYERVRFTDGNPWFKAALYIYGANHGQFNTVWGREDSLGPGMGLFNLRQLLPPEDQQQIAKVYISAFLEATLHGDLGYVPLFRDYRTAPGWLPDTIYLNQYQDANTRLVSTYDEDIDPGTTTLPGGAQLGERLTVWREQLVPAKLADLDTSAVYLGWDRSAGGPAASYTLRLPAQGLRVTAESVLVLSLADADEDPNPATRDVREDRPDASVPRAPLDLTVELIDGNGMTARLPLSTFALVQPQIVGQLGKLSFFSFYSNAQIVFQTFEFPLADFVRANPAFDPANLRTLRLVFDRTPAGVLVLDNAGFRN